MSYLLHNDAQIPEPTPVAHTALAMRVVDELPAVWYADRHFPTFSIELFDRSSLMPVTHVSGWKVGLSLTDGFGCDASDKMYDHIKNHTFEILNGRATITGLRFTTVSSKFGGHFVLSVSVVLPDLAVRLVAPMSTGNIQVLSYRLYHAPKVPLSQLNPDDSVAKMKGIGALYAKRMALLGVGKVRELAALDVDAMGESAFQELIANLRKDRGSMTPAKLIDHVHQARTICQRWQAEHPHETLVAPVAHPHHYQQQQQQYQYQQEDPYGAPPSKKRHRDGTHPTTAPTMPAPVSVVPSTPDGITQKQEAWVAQQMGWQAMAMPGIRINEPKQVDGGGGVRGGGSSEGSSRTSTPTSLLDPPPPLEPPPSLVDMPHSNVTQSHPTTGSTLDSVEHLMSSGSGVVDPQQGPGRFHVAVMDLRTLRELIPVHLINNTDLDDLPALFGKQCSTDSISSSASSQFNKCFSYDRDGSRDRALPPPPSKRARLFVMPGGGGGSSGGGGVEVGGGHAVPVTCKFSVLA